MIAAIDLQWLGIGVAALVVVVLLIFVLLRHRGEDERLMAAARAGQPAAPRAGQPAPLQTGQPATAGPPPGWTGLAAAPPHDQIPATAVAPALAVAATPGVAATAAPPQPTGSFLDEPLARDFEGLGKRHEPVAPPPPPGPFPVDPFGSHEDIFPPEATAAEVVPAVVAVAPAADIAPASAVVAPEAPPANEPAAAPDAPAPLSEVIVTSSHEAVDLADPDVRALLVSLVGDEIALAKACRAQGQTLDAILQLTEAEKACTALGLDDTLAEVKALLAELQA